MACEIINWIDKTLENIIPDNLYKKYFENIQLEDGEERYYLTNRNDGIEIVLSSEKVIESIHLFSGRETNYKKFKEELPQNLNFSMTREEIHLLLGKFDKSGGRIRDIYLGYIPLWEKYFFKAFSLHLQYTESEQFLAKMTIGSLNLEKYFNIGFQ